MLIWHRLCAAFGAVFVLWIVLTGTGIAIADMRALLVHAPASDPDMQKIAQWHTGPSNFVVRQWPDFTASALPEGVNVESQLEKAAGLGRHSVPGGALKAVELRMANEVLAGYVQMNDQRMIFNLATGERLPARFLPLKPINSEFNAPRQTFKRLHRFAFWGPWAIVLNLICGVGLTILAVTGFIHFYRLWRLRVKKGKREPFWKGGNRWRMLHRWVSVGLALPIMWIVLVGMVLSWNNVMQIITLQMKTGSTAKTSETADYSSPIRDEEIAPLARVSLAAFHRDHPGVSAKTFRLRYFANYAQAVIIAADRDTSQLVYNAKNGVAMTGSEPGYPDTFYPMGWEGNQVLKRLHRGDSAGMAGRWLVLLGALGLCYQALSGLVIYFNSWRARKKMGRDAFIWK